MTDQQNLPDIVPSSSSNISKRKWINLEWDDWKKQTGEENISLEEPEEIEVPKPPIFSRSPRKHLVLPTDEVKLLQPPQMPTKASISLVQVLLPLAGVWIGIAIAIYAAKAANPNAVTPLTALVSAPMVLLSAGAGLYNYFSNKRKFKIDKKNRQKIYTKYLDEQKALFETWKNKQIASLLADNPDIDSCLKLVQDCKVRKYEAAQRLWERSPEDQDFIYLRMGTGKLPTSFKVFPPEEPRLVLEKDPLIDDGIGLSNRYQFIDDLPVQLPLKLVGSAGIFGKERTSDLVRSALIQLAAHHAPNEVKVIIVAPEEDEYAWRWTRWLPHVWSDDRKARYFLTDSASRHIVLSEIETLLQQRKNLYQEKQGSKDLSVPLPVYICIFADTNLWTGPDAGPFGPFLDLVLKDGPSFGVYSIFIAERRVQIPKTCGAVVKIETVRDGKQEECVGSLEMVGLNEQEVDFAPDTPDIKTAELFSRTLASIELESIFEAENLPRRATIVDLFGVRKVKDIQLENLWTNSTPYISLHAPIGLRSGNKIAKVDFQEAGRGDGFGSHGMIGGTTGTGKTQFLQTLILLMCAHYKPEYLNFILIDYKGGDLALGLEKLPHLVGTLANVEKEGNQIELIQRLFRSIDVEISRRKGILAGQNINDYIREHMKNPNSMEPLSHLFVIIDEFAEMILKNPVDDPNKSLMKRLLSIGAIGRSIGVHLILATQNPGTVVGDDLRNNINTRICLRMGTRDASMQILRRADAYEKIKKDEVGRAYIQVGNNDIFELIQAAWGGAPDGDDDNLSALPEINLVDYIGARSSAIAKDKRADETNKDNTQLKVLAKRISDLAKKIGSPEQQQVWLPVLPKEVNLEDLLPTKVWDDIVQPNTHVKLDPIIGLLDDPDNRRQEALRIDLTKDGHILIVGSPGTGKTTFLQTLISSLVFEHAPDTLALYLMDWGGRNLTFYESLPHVGAIVLPGENERVRRLLYYLLTLIEKRRKLFESVDAKTISDYRLSSKDAIQDIVIVIDNLSAYVDTYKNQLSPTGVVVELDILNQIAGEGGALGIHLVLTSSSVNVPPKLRERISLVAALELNDNGDYIQVVGRTGGLYPTRDVPGRGIIRQNKIHEFQTALPAKGDNNPQRIATLKDEFKRIGDLWGTKLKAFQIPPLDKILLFEKLDQTVLPANKDDLKGLPICLGKTLSSPELSPFWIDLDWGPHFWISGAPGGGKTTLLQNWLLALAEQYSPDVLRFCLVDIGESGLARLQTLKHAIYCANNSTAFCSQSIETAITDTPDQQNQIANPPTCVRTIIAIDDVAYVKAIWGDKDNPAGNPVFLQSIANIKQMGYHILVAGSANDFLTSGAFPLAEMIKRNRTGFLVAPNDNSLITNFNVKYGVEASRQMQVGWSFFFRRGVPLPVQLAYTEDIAVESQIKKINNKWDKTLQI